MSPAPKNWAQTVLLAATLFSATVEAGDSPSEWPVPASWSSLDQQWWSDVHTLWIRAESGVAFCFGTRERTVLKLLRASFPFPLPTGPPEDAFCSNITRVTARLCGQQEIEYYYKVRHARSRVLQKAQQARLVPEAFRQRSDHLPTLQYLLKTDNPEKDPNLGKCEVDMGGDACAPGFLDASENTSIPYMPWSNEPHACCPGYFCPPMLTCLLPCPFGSYCPRYALSATTPKEPCGMSNSICLITPC